MVAKAKTSEEKNLRQEIIDAAREIFVAEGYDKLSMRRVADKIGYSPTTIYLYFRDKAHLLQDVCEEAFQKLGAAITMEREKGGDPLDVLRKGLHAYIRFGIANPHHYEVAFIAPKGKIMRTGDFAYQGSAGEAAFAMLSDSVAECMRSDLLRKGDVAAVSQTVWASIHGVTSLLIMHGGFPFVDRDELIDSVVETAITGLKP